MVSSTDASLPWVKIVTVSCSSSRAPSTHLLFTFIASMGGASKTFALTLLPVYLRRGVGSNCLFRIDCGYGGCRRRTGSSSFHLSVRLMRWREYVLFWFFGCC